MLKLIWIPIVLYVLAIIIFLAAPISRGSDEGIMLRALTGLGYCIPVLFFALLFIWFFDRRKKRKARGIEDSPTSTFKSKDS